MSLVIFLGFLTFCGLRFDWFERQIAHWLSMSPIKPLQIERHSESLWCHPDCPHHVNSATSKTLLFPQSDSGVRPRGRDSYTCSQAHTRVNLGWRCHKQSIWAQPLHSAWRQQLFTAETFEGRFRINELYLIYESSAYHEIIFCQLLLWIKYIYIYE